MVSRLAPELVCDARAQTAEGPVWDAAVQRLRWVDIPAGAVHEFDPATSIDIQFDIGTPVGAVIPRTRGGLLLVVDDGFAVCATDGTGLNRLVQVEVPTGGRMNDGAADPTGRVWAGSMHPHAAGEAALYRLDENAHVRVVLRGVNLSNGLGWSPDGRAFYYADTPTGRLDAFDVDLERGDLTARRTFATIDRGQPDGLCVDADGCIWVALWAGGAVQRFTPDGRLDQTIELPVTHVTSCAFGGSDLRTLYVTTAKGPRYESRKASEPHAGSIFAADSPVTGIPQTPWIG